MQQQSQQFASDNYAGVCPEAVAAMDEANHGHEPAYGGDSWTAHAADTFRTLFETTCEVYFVFNGTAANSLALQGEDDLLMGEFGNAADLELEW